jgi:hypothetical protein
MDERLTQVYGQVQKILKTYEMCHGEDFIQKLAEDGPFQSSFGFTLRATLHNDPPKVGGRRNVSSLDEYIVGYMFPNYNGLVKLSVNNLYISNHKVTAKTIYAPVFSLFWYPFRDMDHTKLHFWDLTEPFYILSIHDQIFDNKPTEITNVINREKTQIMRFWYPEHNLTIYSMKSDRREYLNDHPDSKILNYPYHNIVSVIQRGCRQFLRRDNYKNIKSVIEVLPGGAEYEQLKAKHIDEQGRFVIGKLD